MVQKPQNRGDLMAEWSALNLQFVWFVADTTNLNPAQLFSDIVGSEPESVQSSKVPRPNNPFLGVAEAQIEQLQYRLTIQPGRVDYFVQSAVEMEFGPGLVEQPAALLAANADGVRRPEIPALRLACVVNLMNLEPSGAAATKTISGLTGNPFPFDDAADVSLQVNRPKLIDKTQINRLLRYSVGTFQFVRLELTPGMIQSAPTAMQTFAANAVGDFNTVPSDVVFKGGELKPIWDILLNEASKFVADPSIKVLD
ncbi:hypothetical protein [Mesorhizobium sp. WSM1293]|uniref:hypothetical protein n=1 Tax=Mesorhizobium sp. WSM1293 TaxID=1040984 RepID=UPI000486DE42|nr:hypothetical protein [Mesorhizobium sp. WSM1293]